MTEERFSPSHLARADVGLDRVSFPVGFIREVNEAASLDAVLAVVARWLGTIITADRASIALADGGPDLRIFALDGNTAIPMDRPVPIDGTLIGRAFRAGEVIVCHDLTASEESDCVMLAAGGLRSSMIAPLQALGVTLGTINLGAIEARSFDVDDAVRLQCMADWVSQQLKMRMQVEEARLLATTDPLTGAANRRLFVERGESQLGRVQESASALTLGVIDLDHFKVINDTYGHGAGDEVLRAVVDFLRSQFRDEDLIARVGGEEFAVLLERADEPAAMAAFERARAGIEGLVFGFSTGVTTTITASIGVAASEPADRSIDDVFRRADAAVYVAKREGRNRVVTVRR